MGMSLSGLASVALGYNDQSEKDRDWNTANAEKQIGLAQAQRAESDIKTERQTYANSATAKAQQAQSDQGGNGANSMVAPQPKNTTAKLPDSVQTSSPAGLSLIPSSPGVNDLPSSSSSATGNTQQAAPNSGLAATQPQTGDQQSSSTAAPIPQSLPQSQGLSSTAPGVSPVVAQAASGNGQQPDPTQAVPAGQPVGQTVQQLPVDQGIIAHAPNAAPTSAFGTQAQMDALDRQLDIATKMRDSAQQNGDIAGGQKWQDTIGNIIQSRKQMDYHNAAAPLVSGDPSGIPNYYNKWINPSNPIVTPFQKQPDGTFVATLKDGTQTQPATTQQMGTLLTHAHYLEDNRAAIAEQSKAQADAQGKITEAQGTGVTAENTAKAGEESGRGNYYQSIADSMNRGDGRSGLGQPIKSEKDPAVIKETEFVAKNMALQNQRNQPDSTLTYKDFLNDAYDKVKSGSGGKISLPEQRSNAEIDAARTTVAGLSQDEIKSRSTKNTPTGRANPNYDPNMARQVKLAQTRKIGPDDTFDQQNGIGGGTGQPSVTGNNAVTGNGNQTSLGGMPISKYTDDQLQRSYNVASPTAQAKIDAELTNRSFTKDATMAGNKLGLQTPKGYQVLDQTGKLIGYYKR